MKKLISIIIVLLALVSLTHCKLAEVEAIPCPEIGIDSIIIPPWDMETEQEIYPFIENQ